MAKYFVVVHASGYNNPFLGPHGIWYPDRESAGLYDEEHAHALAEESKKCFGDRDVIADAFDQPELEEALRKAFFGDLSELSLIRTYREKAGHQSLEYFVRNVLTGRYDPGGLGGRRGGAFGLLYRSWLEFEIKR
jgi:hypothetical protein